MRQRLFAIIVGLLGIAGAYAQDSFATALLLRDGSNSTPALEIDGNRGAYFKYVATEQVVVSVTPKDNEYFNFYLDDTTSESYDYTSTTDANYVSTYSLKVAEGKTLYIFVKQGYSATGTEVGFNAKIYTNVLQHGMTETDPIALVSGSTHWFEGGNAYFTFTSPEDGMLVLTQYSYNYGASYTVDGVKKDLVWNSNTKEMNIPVQGGKEYSIWTSSSSYSMFAVSARFTQPKQGETVEDPFALALGENTVPAAAGKYYYKYLNDGDLGFLTIQADGCIISARTVGNTYDNLSSNNKGKMKLQLDMDQEAIITLEKADDTAEAGVMTATFTLPEIGDIESNPIMLTSSETAQVAAPSGIKYFLIKNNGDGPCFLNVMIDSEGVSSYGNTQFKVYDKADGYMYGGTTISSGEHHKVVIASEKEYMIRVNNTDAEEILFRAWLSEINDGDVYSKPIKATIGENTVTEAGQKFYSYTAASTCRLTLTVGNKETTTAFFPLFDGDEYYGFDLISSGDGVYVLAAEQGEKYIFRLTGASKGEKFTITEEEYGEGQSKDAAIQIQDVYTLDDLNPYKVWLVYNVEKDGVAEITPNGFSSLTYYDNIYYSVNDGSQGNLSGSDANYNTVMLTRVTPVKAGDKIYIQLDVQGYQEGATISVAVRDALPGEAPSNAIGIAVGEATAVPVVEYGGSIWYTFEVESECDVTFKGSDYASVSLYDGALQQIKCGEYSDNMTLGEYYDPYVMHLATGKYYLAVTYTDGTNMTVSGTGIVSGICAVELQNEQAGGMYNLAGQRVSSAKGIVIINGRKIVVK